MTIRIGINGFGRIGRSIFRASLQDPLFSDLEIVAINDLAPTETLVYLLQYDSVMGKMKGSIRSTDTGMWVAERDVVVTHENEPSRIDWDRLGVEIVIEATGHFKHRDVLEGHFQKGVRKVVVTAPIKGAARTIVMGVNEKEYNPVKDHIVSNASCTTNCLAPVVRVIMDRFGVHRGIMNTVHAYTNDQNLLDSPHAGDPRRARAAPLSMIPTTTGAAAAIALVIPELQGRFDGMAVRVPIPNVSLVDIVMEVKQKTTTDEVNHILKEASRKMERILGYTEEFLVSVDLQGDPRSSIVDGRSTRVIDTMVKIISWYDNEWGYSNRMLDLICYMMRVE